MNYEPTKWQNGDTITSAKLNNIEDGVSEVNSEYTPTNWQNGDVITADKLNNIEQGIVNAGGSGMIISQVGSLTFINNTHAESAITFPVFWSKEDVGSDKDWVAADCAYFTPSATRVEFEEVILPFSEAFYTPIWEKNQIPLTFTATQETLDNYDIVYPEDTNFIVIIKKKNSNNIPFNITFSYVE